MRHPTALGPLAALGISAALASPAAARITRTARRAHAATAVSAQLKGQRSRTGTLRLAATRIAGGQLRATATATIVTKASSPPLTAQLQIVPCTAALNRLTMPFTGPTLFFSGQVLTRTARISASPGTQRFTLTGTANAGRLAGNWTDCAAANLYPGGAPYVLFPQDATAVLTVTQADGRHVAYP